MWEFSTRTGQECRGVQAVRYADRLYCRTRSRACWGQFWSMLTRRSHSLLQLSAVEATCNVRSRCWAGIQTVRLRSIRGSEGRCQDFDADFRPLKELSRKRWMAIAAAWELGTGLPPVKLVQIRDLYFVRDGHHRISVARARGQENIEAEVTAWEVTGALPWEQPVKSHRPLSAGNLVGQQT